MHLIHLLLVFIYMEFVWFMVEITLFAAFLVQVDLYYDVYTD